MADYYPPNRRYAAFFASAAAVPKPPPLPRASRPGRLYARVGMVSPGAYAEALRDGFPVKPYGWMADCQILDEGGYAAAYLHREE